MKKTAITLLSGGLDSTVATLLARKKYRVTLALTFDYGQRAAMQEIKAARLLCRRFKIDHEIIKIPWLFNISHSSLTEKFQDLPHYRLADLDNNPAKEKKNALAVWVPNRNAVFVNIAAAYAEAMHCDFIIAGFNAEEAVTFPDNSKEFVDEANRLFSVSTLSHPKLISPTLEMKKKEIARKAAQLKIKPEFFWSCYEGGAKMCGACESCARAIRAFDTIGEWNLIKFRFKRNEITNYK